MRTILTAGARGLAVVLVVVLWTARAAAQQPADLARAKESFQAGATAYAAGDYLAAIQALDAAYELTPLPAIAFSLAQAERRQYFVAHDPKDLERAITLYRRYAAEMPSGGRRAEALDTLSQLEPLAAVLASKAADLSPPTQPAVARPTRLMITSNAPGARVTLDDGAPVGSPLIREVAPGRHRVTVNAAGFVAGNREVTAVAGELIPVELSLRERTSSLSVAFPSGAEVYVDGVFVSHGGDKLDLELPSGTHRLTVADKGRRVWSRTVELERGQAQRIDVTLESTSKRKISLGLLVASGVAVAAGVGLGALALGAQSHAQEFLDRQARGNVGSGDLRSYQNAVSNRNSERTAAAISFGWAIGLGAAGLVLRELDNPDAETIFGAGRSPNTARRETPPTSGLRRLSFAPEVVPGHLGVAVGASF